MPDFIFKGKVYYNPVQLVMEQIGGVWKMPILWRLKDQIMRYGELRNDIPHISDKMLTTQLRELETDGYVHREVYAVVPPKTEYSLTEKGREVSFKLENMVSRLLKKRKKKHRTTHCRLKPHPKRLNKAAVARVV
jgi:DNA-binding HxlR family transcriptional regulator